MSMEETIVLKDVKLEEINKYYIDDSLSDTDKIEYIINQGYECQIEQLIKNLSHYFLSKAPYGINRAFIFSKILHWTDNIYLLNKTCQKLFSKALSEITINWDTKNENDINLLLNHFLIGITTFENLISEEYSKNWNTIIDHFSAKGNNIGVNDNIIELTEALGRFGEVNERRKNCVFWSISWWRISKTFIGNWYTRLRYLFDDSDRMIRLELAYQLRFIIQLSNDRYQNHIDKIEIRNYIEKWLEQGEWSLVTMIIDSIMFENNFGVYSGDKGFDERMVGKINDVFSVEDYYIVWNSFESLVKIFICLVDAAYSRTGYCDWFYRVIKNYLNKFAINIKIFNTAKTWLVLDTDYLFSISYKIIGIITIQNDITFLNEFFNFWVRILWCDNQQTPVNNNKNDSDNYSDSAKVQGKTSDIFYINLPWILENLPNNFITIHHLNSIFYFLDRHFSKINKIPPTLKHDNCKENTDSPWSTRLKTPNSTAHKEQNLFENGYLYKSTYFTNLPKISKEMFKNKNETFITFILGNWSRMINLIWTSTQWRIQISLLEVVGCWPLHIKFNYLKIDDHEEILDKILSLGKDLLSTGRNIHVEKEVMNLFCEGVLCSKNRECWLEYLKNDILNSPSYYRRRMFYFFIDRAYSALSNGYLMKLGLVAWVLERFTTEVDWGKCQIMTLLIKYDWYSSQYSNKVREVYNSGNIRDSVWKTWIEKYLHHSMANLESLYSHHNTPTTKTKDEAECIKVSQEKKIEEIEQLISDANKREDVVIKKTKSKKGHLNFVGSCKKWSLLNKPTSLVMKKFENEKDVRIQRKNSVNNFNVFKLKDLNDKQNVAAAAAGVAAAGAGKLEGRNWFSAASSSKKVKTAIQHRNSVNWCTSKMPKIYCAMNANTASGNAQIGIISLPKINSNWGKVKK